MRPPLTVTLTRQGKQQETGIRPNLLKQLKRPQKPRHLACLQTLYWDQIPSRSAGQKYAPPPKYNEVPFFADLVAAGKLPPISERLPLEPFVVGPGVLNSEQWLDWEVGRYGGTIRTTNLNGSMHELALAMGMTILRAPDQSTRDPLPAIVSSYEINSDFTQYTLTIREGLKWSDGVTVTTEECADDLRALRR